MSGNCRPTAGAAANLAREGIAADAVHVVGNTAVDAALGGAARLDHLLASGALALPEPLQRLRRALLRHEGGDKVMARVLMAVPTHGLEVVLVAVDLVLESGRPSAEHVLNVLARLTDGPAPPSVATALTVATVPLADPHRYDQLHEEEATHG